MHLLNKQFGGQLDLAIKIFTDQYHKPFLHQLISGQLDVDRMDYLSRDSFYSGVSEGVIGYDRILKMLVVHEGQLMVEEKGIYSVEKFLVARRQMYWQVYLHKTVLSAEKMLVKILERVRSIYTKTDKHLSTQSALDFFLGEFNGKMDTAALEKFCGIDDHDVMHAIKHWSHHPDTILSLLCRRLLDRKLYKVKIQAEPFDEAEIRAKEKTVMAAFRAAEQDIPYLCFTGEATNTLYQTKDERIDILFKDGTVTDISRIENALIDQNLSAPVKKFYICFLTE
jgi:HD superfamily phosphohydrolase